MRPKNLLYFSFLSYYSIIIHDTSLILEFDYESAWSFEKFEKYGKLLIYWLQVSFGGENIEISGTQVRPVAFLPQSTGTYIGHIIISITDLAAKGYWTMNISTTASPIPCVAQVKALSNVELFYRFVQGQDALNTDGGNAAPSPTSKHSL